MQSSEAGLGCHGLGSVGKAAWLECREDAQHQGQEEARVQSLKEVWFYSMWSGEPLKRILPGRD